MENTHRLMLATEDPKAKHSFISEKHTSLEQQRVHGFGPPEVGCFRCLVAPYPLSPLVHFPSLEEEKKFEVVVIAFTSPFGLAMVLLGREPEPEVEAVLLFTNLIHLVLDELELGMVELEKSEKTVRSNLVSKPSEVRNKRHPLVVVNCGGFTRCHTQILSTNSHWAGQDSGIESIYPPPQVSTTFSTATHTHGAGVWFFLSRSNALTISLTSATSDETAGVEELVLTLATMALLRD
ncbi:hypothetical protein Tco_1317471 [Tanacetum coccineum]